jgi:hydroxymethylbilane synthase
MMRRHITIGTRKSALALWQSNFIKSRLNHFYPDISVELKHIITRGDRTQDAQVALPLIGGKGLFTAELEEGLLAGDIDLAVHSLKDLPTKLADEFLIAAIPKREVCQDVLISRGRLSVRELRRGAVVGTSSLRRASQLLRIRPDLKIEHIRGNIDSRISKALSEQGSYDAIVLAYAGVVRLGLEGVVSEVLSFEDMLPAPGQGALSVECRKNDRELIEALRVVHDIDTAKAVNTERAFLAALEAGCNTPVAALALVERDEVSGKENLVFRGRCVSQDGAKTIEVGGVSSELAPDEFGVQMAQEALFRGFKELTCDGRDL